MKEFLSILVVDDEKEITTLLKTTLSDLGHRVVEAKDGQEAAFKFTNQTFDLVITDLKMPKFDGPHLASLLRKNAPALPFIFISGNITEYKNAFDHLENYSFLSKPFTNEQLVNEVKKMTAVKVPEDKSNVILEPNQVLFNEGDSSSELYFVKSGTLQISKMVDDQSVIVTKINMGEIVGELAMFTGGKRSARVTALTKAELVKIPKSKVDAELEALPKWIKILLKSTIHRLVETTALYAKEVNTHYNKPKD
ncbi:MAG: response regulator [Bacteriovoracaceae bacterium]